MTGLDIVRYGDKIKYNIIQKLKKLNPDIEIIDKHYDLYLAVGCQKIYGHRYGEYGISWQDKIKELVRELNIDPKNFFMDL